MTEPMRVLRLIARLNVGGPARHVVWLNEALAASGADAHLVTGVVPPGESDMSAFATEHGVTPTVLPSMSRELSPRDVVTIWRLWRLMVELRPQIVHTHTAKAGAVGRIAGLLYRVFSPKGERPKFVHTFHGHVFHGYYGPLKTRLFLAIERMLARLNTDRIVVLSEQQLREIHGTFSIGRREQFAVVPLGIDIGGLHPAPAAREALRTELGIGADALVVGIVGRVTAIKNHEMFLQVASMLQERATFVVFGDGELRASLQARGGKVIFAGMREARDIYAAIDVLALTSRNEGTPLAIIEAMMTGKPVVSTEAGGVVDLLGFVEEQCEGYAIRERGITAAPDDVSGFAAGLMRLLGDDMLRERVREHGREHAVNSYSRERLAADILRLYQSLLSVRGEKARNT